MSWESLQAIVAEARELAREEATSPPLACPNDGEPLETGSGGQLYCKFDGWRPE